MKRKIEKYLSASGRKIKKEDGRYDFDGDMDGVLSAVRESDGSRVLSSRGKTSATSSVGKKNRNSSISGGNSSRKKAKRSVAADERATVMTSSKNSIDTPRLNQSDVMTTTVKSSKVLTAKVDKSLFPNDSSTKTNSVSKTLFGKTPSKKSDGNVMANPSNIFFSPRSASLKFSSVPTSKKGSSKVNTSDKRDLRTTFTTGRASILSTPQVLSKKVDLIEDVNFESIKGFTPLSMVKTKGGVGGQFDEIFDAGALFSPSELFADDGKDTYVDGLKTPKRMTPHASSHPRMCIANVRFGATPKTTDMKQRHVAISPIGSMQSVQQNMKKRRSLFDSINQSEKRHRNDGANTHGFGMVTPSFSVSSSTTVTTYPLTVCSSAASIRTTMTLEELSKIKPLVFNSTLQKEDSSLNETHPHQTDCSGLEPKHIDAPLENLSPIMTVKKIDAHGSVEKFWSRVGGLEHLTPFRSDGAASSSTPFNSE